jgi:hypothetical protein
VTLPTHRGDELLPDANMCFDRVTVLDATPEEIWPWLVQLGKQRAGWYLPDRLERMLPSTRRAARTLQPRWQTLAVGDRIPDYGGRDAWLEAVQIDAPNTLVYRSQRGRTEFTWALLLEAQTDQGTQLRLRFRGRLHSAGLLRQIIIRGGDFFDWATAQLMVVGLKQRIARQHSGTPKRTEP